MLIVPSGAEFILADLLILPFVHYPLALEELYGHNK